MSLYPPECPAFRVIGVVDGPCLIGQDVEGCPVDDGVQATCVDPSHFSDVYFRRGLGLRPLTPVACEMLALVRS